MSKREVIVKCDKCGSVNQLIDTIPIFNPDCESGLPIQLVCVDCYIDNKNENKEAE